MTNEIRQMIRLATGRALLVVESAERFSLISAMLAGLQPVVFLACGVCAGAVYGGIVGAVLGARETDVESEPEAAAVAQRRRGLALVVARPRFD